MRKLDVGLLKKRIESRIKYSNRIFLKESFFNPYVSEASARNKECSICARVKSVMEFT